MDKEILEAILYDWHNDNVLENQNKDILYYKNYLKNKKDLNILIVGAGTGRVAIPLSNICENITALDMSIGRLIELYNKYNNDLEIVCCDIIDYKNTKKFDVIIFPYSTIQNINPKKWDKVLKKIQSLLSFGGECLIDYNEHFSTMTGSSKEMKCETYSVKLNKNIKEVVKTIKRRNHIKVIRNFYDEKKVLYKAIEKWYVFDYIYFEKLAKIEKLKIKHIEIGYGYKNYNHKKIIILQNEL